jgi:hypothetical protein
MVDEGLQRGIVGEVIVVGSFSEYAGFAAISLIANFVKKP